MLILTGNVKNVISFSFLGSCSYLTQLHIKEWSRARSRTLSRLICVMHKTNRWILNSHRSPNPDAANSACSNLNHYGQVTPYGVSITFLWVMNRCHHLTNVDWSSTWSCGIHLSATLLEMLKVQIAEKITYIKIRPYVSCGPLAETVH